MNEGLRNTLGEERFQDYMRQTDYDYKSIAKVAERQGLNNTVSAQVYQMKNEAEELARSIRMDGGIRSTNASNSCSRFTVRLPAALRRSWASRARRHCGRRGGTQLAE